MKMFLDDIREPQNDYDVRKMRMFLDDIRVPIDHLYVAQ